MAEDYRIEHLRRALAGPSKDLKIEAVLKLPDDVTGAVPLLEKALDGSELDLRVALLDALFRLRGDRSIAQELIAIMDSPATLGDAGEELYMMARIALNRIEGDTADVLNGEGRAFELHALSVPGEGRDLAVIIHGTWASKGDWWRPHGDFHTYLKEQLAMEHLYSGEDPFVWSGRNRDRSRHNAATSLQQWIEGHNPKRLEIYAHSHGANVSMLATHLGLHIHRLVMLSPPVRSDYFALWDEVEEAFNIQARFDPVVGIARGGRWFDVPKVRELELANRGHSASHDPAVWEQNQVPKFLGLPASE